MRDVLGWRCKFGVLGPSTNTIVQPDFDDLRRRIIGLVGADTGPNSLAEKTEVELDCDYGLKYANVVRAITALPSFILSWMYSGVLRAMPVPRAFAESAISSQICWA